MAAMGNEGPGCGLMVCTMFRFLFRLAARRVVCWMVMMSATELMDTRRLGFAFMALLTDKRLGVVLQSDRCTLVSLNSLPLSSVHKRYPFV